jgi:DNA gyrase/topoisomerase IV subunit B
MNIDLSKYKLVRPESISSIEGIKKFYDIEVESDHTFHIVGQNDLILSHNCDGNSISGLLLNFFYKYWPDMFDKKMIYKVETPIVVAIPKKGKSSKILFYTQSEYNTWSAKADLKQFEIKYKKGLGALVDDEYNAIINSPKMTLITKDDVSTSSLETWFGKNSDLRKVELLK